MMAKNHPAAWVQAMRHQGTVKVEDFPIGNRAARRRAKAGAAKQRLRQARVVGLGGVLAPAEAESRSTGQTKGEHR